MTVNFLESEIGKVFNEYFIYFNGLRKMKEDVKLC